MRKSGMVMFLATGLSVLPVVSARGQAPEIAHDAVSCIVAGKYPKLKACFAPAEQVAKARVYFRREDRPVWYHVEMASEEACFVGILPRPGEELIGKKVPYYVEVASRKLDMGRTQEHGPQVVRAEGECKLQAVAPYLSQASVKVFPDMPPGFSAGGFGRGWLAGGAVAAIGIGVGVLAGGGGNDPAVSPTPAPGPAAPPPTPAPVPPTPPTPAPVNGPPSGVFAVSPDPPAGVSPMPVRFNLCRSSDPDDDPLVFRYDFGDGQRARGSCREEHVYEAPQGGEVVYQAEACVGDGRPEHEQCQKFAVLVKGQGAPPPPPPGPFALTVALAGSGSGRVTSDTGGIDCPGTCSATYAPGTVVTLSAAAAGGSTFAGWTGAGCSGTGTCQVVMSATQSVTATFNAIAVPVPLTVTLAGDGAGRVTSDSGGIDCPGTCSAGYPAGTPVVLTAAAGAGSSFTGWSVPGCGRAATCTVTMTAAQNVTATFQLIATPRRITVQRTGNGLVESDVQPGIVCGGACSFPSFVDGSTVVLTQTPDPNWFFSGWGGDGPCTGTGRTCTLLMNRDYVINATFVFAARPAEQRSSSLSWVSDLRVPRGRGQVFLGQRAWQVEQGEQRTTVAAAAGEERVQATLLQAGGGGLWRFELADGVVEPGTLRVIEGKVQALAGNAVVFRLAGKAGERVAFVYRLARH